MLENCLLLIGVLFLGMASPGPDFLLVLKNACSGNRRFANGTAVGITLGIVLHLAYCALGLGLLISKSIIAYNFVKYAGACYLIFIGIKSLFSRAENQVDFHVPHAVSKGQSFARGVKEGFLCNALNPKVTVFFVSVISQFFQPETNLLEMSLYCALIIILNTLYWLLMVSLLQKNIVQSFVASARSVIDRAFGALLLAIGVRVAFAD